MRFQLRTFHDTHRASGHWGSGHLRLDYEQHLKLIICRSISVILWQTCLYFHNLIWYNSHLLMCFAVLKKNTFGTSSCTSTVVSNNLQKSRKSAFLKFYFIFIYVYVSLCLCECQQRPDVGVRTSWNEILGSCGPPGVRSRELSSVIFARTTSNVNHWARSPSLEILLLYEEGEYPLH